MRFPESTCQLCSTITAQMLWLMTNRLILGYGIRQVLQNWFSVPFWVLISNFRARGLRSSSPSFIPPNWLLSYMRFITKSDKFRKYRSSLGSWDQISLPIYSLLDRRNESRSSSESYSRKSTRSCSTYRSQRILWMFRANSHGPQRCVWKCSPIGYFSYHRKEKQEEEGVLWSIIFVGKRGNGFRTPSSRSSEGGPCALDQRNDMYHQLRTELFERKWICVR